MVPRSQEKVVYQGTRPKLMGKEVKIDGGVTKYARGEFLKGERKNEKASRPVVGGNIFGRFGFV